MPFSHVSLPNGLAVGATVTAAYPAGVTQATAATSGNTFVAAGAIYQQGTHFTLTLGAGTVTMTWVGPSVLPRGTSGTLHIARAPATETDLEAAVAAAEAAASAASAAAATTNGVVVLTTTPNTAAEYIATGAVGAGSGKRAQWTPDVANSGDCFLTWNSTRRRLRPRTGASTLVAGAVVAGEALDIFDNGSSYVILGVSNTGRTVGRHHMIGAAATLDGYLTEGSTVVSRLGGFSAGSIFGQVDNGAGGVTTAFYAYGSGNAAGRPTGEFRTFYDTRIEGNLTVVGTLTATLPASTLDAVQPTDAIIQVMEEFGGSNAYETLAETRTVLNTHPYQITPSDAGRQVRCNVNGAWIDCGDMMDGSTALLNIQTAGTVTIYTGEAVNWTDRTQSRVQVSKGRYRVHHGIGNEWEIEAVNGKTITDVTTTIPTCNRRIAVLGYSNGVRTIKNVSGWRDQFATWGEDPSVVNVISGVGASCFLEGGESGFIDGNAGTYNHWWKSRTSAPGPNIATFLAAVAAQPSTPTLEFVFVHLGYPDMNLWNAADNPISLALTEAQMVTAWADCLNYIKGASGLNLPSLKFIICPMAHRHVAVWDRKLWYAQRRMMLQLCADHPTLAVRGPDSFDLRYIPADGHPTIRSQSIFSARWARWSETIAGRKTEFLGPKVIDVIQDSNTSTRVIIDPYDEAMTFPGRSGDLTNAPIPPGIALLPPGSDYITHDPIEISNLRWSVSSGNWVMTLTHADTAGVRFCWPYGFMNETGEDPAQCIRATLSGDPLQTYHPTV